MRVARLLFAFGAIGWIVLLMAAPLTAFGVPLSGITYALGSLICHQRPERSFHLAAAQLPVCARCFGLYVGAAMAVFAGLKPCATGLKPWMWRSPSGLRSASTLRSLLLVAAVPTAVTWGAEFIGLWAPANATRFAAALPLGAAVALTVNYVGCARPPRTVPTHQRIPTSSASPHGSSPEPDTSGWGGPRKG